MNKKEKNFNKCPICGRPTLKKSKYCIFHASAEEKTEEEFKKALKEYVKRVKKEDSDYNFRKFVFVGDIDFRKDLSITILKNADFSFSTFYGPAIFNEISFYGDLVITMATFMDFMIFRDVFLKSFLILESTTFQKDVIFFDVTFNAKVVFIYNTFKEDISITNSIFKSEVEMIDNTLHNGINFEFTNFISKATLKFAVTQGIISFRHSTIKNSRLIFYILNKEILLDFEDAELKNTKINKNEIIGHILHEEKKQFSKAKKIFHMLKDNFLSIGRYEDSNWAFIKAMNMERISCSFREFKKYRI